MTQNSLFLFAKISPKAEYFSNAKNAVLAIVEQTRSEDGCKQFELHEGELDGCLYLYEEWSGESELITHHNKSYTKSVFKSYEAWLKKPIEIAKMRKAS